MKIYVRITIIRDLLMIISLLLVSRVAGLELKKEIELQSKWRIEIGDEMKYKNPDFNDSDWEFIKVPCPWENDGFPGYDGYAWYRITFEIPERLREEHLYLKLGRIDDVDMTFFNGKLIGESGVFPPNYKTAYNKDRVYPIPQDIIKFDRENTIAVRVYDFWSEGGIVRSEVGIFSRKDIINLAIDLSGKWKFKPEDHEDFAMTDFNDKKWDEIKVPDEWENQGYRKYDGIAWYRTNVKISKKLNQHKLILMLGKINDVDQVYFNGQMIGSTGHFPIPEKKAEVLNKKFIERAYFIPPALIKENKSNVVAVRVYDAGRTGGIYEGYIGIVTRQEYLKYQKRKD